MALGNTPQRSLEFRLEAAKSYAFGVRFTDADGAIDVSGDELRLVLSGPFYGNGATPLLTVTAEDDGDGGKRFELQASQLALEPDAYPVDITLYRADGFSVPVVKAVFVIGTNTDSDTSNVYDIDRHMDSLHDVVISMDGTDVVEVCVQQSVGKPGPQGDKGEPGGIFIQPDQPGPNDVPIFVPLWVDTDDPDEPVIGISDVIGLESALSSIADSGLDQAEADARYVNISGDTMTGGLTVGGTLIVDAPSGIVAHRVTLAQEPTDAAEAATKGYVDDALASGGGGGGGGGLTQAAADARYVNTSGDTMAGSLTFPQGTYLQSYEPVEVGDPVQASDAATKAYVDAVAGSGGGGLDQAAADALYVNADGDTMEGSLYFPQGTYLQSFEPVEVGDPAGPSDAVNRGYADSRYVNTAGDTMTGNLTVGGDLQAQWFLSEHGMDAGGYKVTRVGAPTDGEDAANKSYVDSRIWKGTQAAYDAIAVKDPDVLYCVKG